MRKHCSDIWERLHMLPKICGVVKMGGLKNIVRAQVLVCEGPVVITPFICIWICEKKITF